MFLPEQSVLTYFKKKRWKGKAQAIVSIMLACILLICLYEYSLYRSKERAAKHPFYPILPLAERRRLRGGSIFEKAKLAKLPGLELNSHIPDKLKASQSSRQLEFNFFNFLEHEDVICHKPRRLGNHHEGGWTTCIAPPFVFKSPCLVYSFGIGGDWRFEEDMADLYHCQVMAFDPSINKTEHNRTSKIWFKPVGLGGQYSTKTAWSLKTFHQILTDDGNTKVLFISYNINKTEHKRTSKIWFKPVGLGGQYSTKTAWPLKTFHQVLTDDGNTNATIDFLKFDIEFMEWEVIQDMFGKGDNSLQNVKQLAFEIHLMDPVKESENKTFDRHDFIQRYQMLKLIETTGFRKFGYRANPFCYYRSGISGEQRSWCYDLFYLNIKYVEDKHLRKGKFLRLMLTFGNSLDPDESEQNCGLTLAPNCMTLFIILFYFEF